MKKALSPYYKTIPFVSPLTGATCTSYTLNVYVWAGLEASVPVTNSYSFTKSNPTASVLSDKVNLSGIIESLITVVPIKSSITSLLDSTNQRWVKTEVIYTTADPLDDDVKQLETTELFCRGYAYGDEGENTDTPTNKILAPNIEYKVFRGGFFCLPIDMQGYDFPTDPAITIKSYPNSEVDESFAETLTTNSNEIVRYVFVSLSDAVSDEYLEIIYNGVTITLYFVDECRYTPVDIFFINKEGQQQSLTFFKSKTDNINVTSEQFTTNRGQPSLGFHQTIRYNIQGNSSFRVNSGFVDEAQNEVFTQLLLSDYVWQLKDDVFIPLIVKTQNFEYKTRQKDRLINYELTFDYAFNKINNI